MADQASLTHAGRSPPHRSKPVLAILNSRYCDQRSVLQGVHAGGGDRASPVQEHLWYPGESPAAFQVHHNFGLFDSMLMYASNHSNHTKNLVQRPGGVLCNAFDLKLKNPANTNVMCWGNRLLALWEVSFGAACRAMSITHRSQCVMGFGAPCRCAGLFRHHLTSLVVR